MVGFVQLIVATPQLRVALSNRTVFGFGVTPGGSAAGYMLTNTGDIQTQEGLGGYTTVEQWLISGNAADCEVLCTITSGTLTSGTSGSWLALSSGRSWSVTDTNAGALTKSCTFTLQIRKIGTTTVLASATITLESDYSEL